MVVYMARDSQKTKSYIPGHSGIPANEYADDGVAKAHTRSALSTRITKEIMRVTMHICERMGSCIQTKYL